MESTLSKEAQKIIALYKNIPVGQGCACPYFNNRRAKIIGGLRAYVGKGSPKDIQEEAEIVSYKERVSLKDAPSESVKKFLIDHGFGIDCSGFAYHVLDAELKSTKKRSLSSVIKVKGSFFKKLKAKFRPAENTGVATFALGENSMLIEQKDIRAGDFIIFLNTGKEKDYNHIVVIESTNINEQGFIINYVHSFTWPRDGKYGHGVRSGKIILANKNTPILQGEWIENNLSGSENYTFQNAVGAKSVSIRRLNAYK